MVHSAERLALAAVRGKGDVVIGGVSGRAPTRRERSVGAPYGYRSHTDWRLREQDGGRNSSAASGRRMRRAARGKEEVKNSSLP